VTGASGRQYAISFFRFYVSEPALTDAHGVAYPAALLGPDGSAQPYGVHLLVLEDTSTHVLRLAATPGEFVGIELGIGLPALCHRLPPREQISPLDNASGMTWDWAGYLHLRFEGTVAGGVVQHHLFQEMAFTRVVVPGSIRVGSQASTPMLVLDVDRLLEQGMPLTTPSAHGVEGWIMDNFERNAALVLR